MSGTRELPIDIIECVEDDGKLDRSSTLTWKWSARATMPMSRPCTGVYLAMPHGVFPYSAYPFMLHEKFVLPWSIHIAGHRMTIQSTQCAGVRETESDSCQPCSRLLTHRIVEGIICRIETGINANTNHVYQPIGALIEIVQKKSAMLDELHFKQLSALRTLVARARTVGRYEQLVMAMGEGKVNRLDALL